MKRNKRIKDPPLQDWEDNHYTENPDLPDVHDLVEVSKSSKEYKTMIGTFGRIHRVKDFLPSPEELRNAKVRIYKKGKLFTEYLLRDGKRVDK